MGSVLRTTKQMRGDHGEDLACEHYIARGYEIVGRNVIVSRIGEIDIIARRHIDNCMEYVFIEVKTRSSARAGFGYEAVNRRKIQRMVRCALSWFASNVDRSLGYSKWRLDVVSIDLSNLEPHMQVFEHVEN